MKVSCHAGAALHQCAQRRTPARAGTEAQERRRLMRHVHRCNGLQGLLRTLLRCQEPCRIRQTRKCVCVCVCISACICMYSLLCAVCVCVFVCREHFCDAKRAAASDKYTQLIHTHPHTHKSVSRQDKRHTRPQPTRTPVSETLYPKPYTQHPKPNTRNPKPNTLNPKPNILNPKSNTLNPTP